MANANVDQNWLRGVLAIAQNNPAGHLQTQPYAANSNQGNVKFIYDGRMYFKHRVLRAGSISAMCDQQTNGCKEELGFNRTARLSRSSLSMAVKQIHQTSSVTETEQNDEEKNDAEAHELNTLWAKLQAMELTEGNLNEYLDVDGQLATVGTLTPVEIAADVSRLEVEKPESDTDVMEKDEEPVLPTVRSREAKEAVETLLRYSSNPKVLHLCDIVDDLLAEERIKKLKQKMILDYFTIKNVILLKTLISVN